MAKVNEGAVPVMEIWRGGLLECVHQAHAVICDAKGVVAAWGNPQAVIFPHPSCKKVYFSGCRDSGSHCRVSGYCRRSLASLIAYSFTTYRLTLGYSNRGKKCATVG